MQLFTLRGIYMQFSGGGDLWGARINFWALFDYQPQVSNHEESTLLNILVRKECVLGTKVLLAHFHWSIN